MCQKISIILYNIQIQKVEKLFWTKLFCVLIIARRFSSFYFLINPPNFAALFNK